MSDRYVAGLTEYRSGLYEEWCDFFTVATGSAAIQARKFAEEIAESQTAWAGKFNPGPRKGSATANLLALLPVNPVVGVPLVAAKLQLSDEAARIAINNLAEAGILKQTPMKRWPRVYAANEVYTMLDNFERELATPEGQNSPVRMAPPGRQI